MVHLYGKIQSASEVHILQAWHFVIDTILVEVEATEVVVVVVPVVVVVN